MKLGLQRQLDEAMDHAVALAALAAEGEPNKVLDLLASLDGDERRALWLAQAFLAANYAALLCAEAGVPEDRVAEAIRAGLVRVRGDHA